MACAGDIPTLETLAAVDLLRRHLPDLRIRVVNVFDPWLIHRLTYRRTNHANLHVRGHKEEGTTTTPFGMTVLNDRDRFHLAGDVIDRVPRLGNVSGHVKQFLRDKLTEHKGYIEEHGDDPPEIRDWKWPY